MWESWLFGSLVCILVVYARYIRSMMDWQSGVVRKVRHVSDGIVVDGALCYEGFPVTTASTP